MSLCSGRRGHVAGNEQVYEKSIYTRQHADTGDNIFFSFNDTDEMNIDAGVAESGLCEGLNGAKH